VITSFRTYEGAGSARKRVREPKVATASTENQRQGKDEGKSSDAHPRPPPTREMRVLRRRRGGVSVVSVVSVKPFFCCQERCGALPPYLSKSTNFRKYWSSAQTQDLVCTFMYQMSRRSVSYGSPAIFAPPESMAAR
jgi:hypothetical protein